MGNKVLWRVHLFVLWFVLFCFFNPMFQCHWNLSNDLNCKSEILISTDFHYVILPCKKHIRFLKSVILSRAVPKNWKRIDDFLVKLYIKSVAEMKRIYIQIDITTQWGPGFTNIINQKEIVALQKKKHVPTYPIFEPSGIIPGQANMMIFNKKNYYLWNYIHSLTYSLHS